MHFSINKIILWPRNDNFHYREIIFETNKINIITGASRTGKSAIIPIIDYCLGSTKCSIPVDTIRKACSWFGVLFNMDNEQILICRKEPGLKLSSTEMFVLRGDLVNIPNYIISNTTCDEVKNILNELFAISFLDNDPTSDKIGSARPSYRDFMAFLFQPQNIVANSDVLFFKADTSEHRQRLIELFPYALGAVTPAILAKRIELERLRKQRDRIQRDINTIQLVSENWKQEVNSWISQAHELGLTDYKLNGDESFNSLVNEINRIVEKNVEDVEITNKSISNYSEELIKLQIEERDISSKLFLLQKRKKDMLDLESSISKYEDSLQIQLNRLEISNWLRNLVKEQTSNNSIDLVTDSTALTEIESLCSAISEIEKTAGDMKSSPAALERELQSVESDISICSERLKAIRKRIIEENRLNEKEAEHKYTLYSNARFLGKMESSLNTYNKVGADSELEKELNTILTRINELSSEVDEKTIKKKQDAALSYINQRIGEIIQGLDIEYPENPVSFIIKDLSIKICGENGRNDYLWEIGSASNWLAYHIATILAFQQFFQKRGKVAVPNFIVFDQPSQVYFPHFNQIRNSKDVDYISDEDKNAVRMVFKTMSDYIEKNEYGIQIIVMEHADEDIWGDIKNVHLVERWRDEEHKLIPSSWIE